MSEKKTNLITINDNEYNIDVLDDRGKALLFHAKDLERKIKNSETSLEQMKYGREAILKELEQLLIVNS